MTRSTPTVVALLLTALAAVHCPETSRRPPPRPDGPRQGAPAPARGAPADPTEHPPLEVIYGMPDAGDLAAEVSAFPGLDQCASALGQQLAPPMAEVLADIGYNDLALDGCRALEALAESSIEGCDRLELRFARLGCRRRYAMFHGEPELCPAEPAQGGRAPLCVAVAMRDPSMCRARRSREEIGVCRAIILQSERPCRVAHDNATAAGRCAVAARRWWGAMPEERSRPALPHGFEPIYEIRVSTGEADGGFAPPAASRLLERGITLPPGELVVGARHQPPIGDRPPLLELRAPRPTDELPQTFELGPMGAAAWLRLGDDPPIDSGESTATGEVVIERFAPLRGAIVEGTATLRLQPPLGEPVRVEARFRTFVRDVTSGEAGRE